MITFLKELNLWKSSFLSLMISVNDELSISNTSRPAPKTLFVLRASIKSAVLTIDPLLVFNSQKGLLNFSMKVLLNKLNVKFVCGK